jgi:hypothetical protein
MSNNDVMYYNLTIGNNAPEVEGVLNYPTIPAQITANNNIPIIQNPDDYYACIIRFQIPAITLPLANIVIQTPVADINKTIYSFAITDNAGTPNNTQTFVEWSPQVILPAGEVPKVGTLTQTFNEYYLCYSYRWFIDLWNTALNDACVKYGGIDFVPFFEYDSATQLISLYAPKDFTTFGNGYKIWINNNFLSYFVGYEKVNVNQTSTNNAYGLDNYLVVRNSIIDTLPLFEVDYFKNSYEYSAYGYWNFLKSIAITTTMNVNSQAVYNNNSSQYSNNTAPLSTFQNVNYVNILEDYYPDLALQQGAGVSSQIFTYNAPSLYRIFTFNQKTPLYKVDLGINVVDTYGFIFPLQLPKGQLATFKIMFIKKSVYANIVKMAN